MSQQDSHCKRHKYQHVSDQPHSVTGKRLAAALRLNSQCKLVNKAASVNIWATERLYEKWRREAAAELQPDGRRRHHSPRTRSALRSYKASQPRHRGGGECFQTMLVPRDSDWPSPHGLRAQSRSETAHQRNHHTQRHRQHSRQHRHHHLRRLSLSNESAEPHFRQCQWAQQPQQQQKQQQQKQKQQSERTSDIDWPDSWPSIWGSSAPQCVQEQEQQQHTSSNSRDRPAGKSGGRYSSRHERYCRHHARPSMMAYQGNQILTLEALVTIKSVESDSNKRVDSSRKGGCDKHATAGRLSSNSSRPTHMRSTRRQSIDQGTYTIDREVTVAQQKLLTTSSEQRPTGKVEQQINVGLTVEQQALEYLSSSQNGGEGPSSRSISTSSSTLRVNRAPDNGKLSNATAAVAAAKRVGRAVDSTTRPTVNSVRRSHKALRDSAAAAASSIAYNNSVDDKSLQMLSTATTERDVDAGTPASETMRAAFVSRVKPTRLHTAAVSSQPEIMMKSNATVNDSNGQMMSSTDDLDDIIQTQIEIGESTGIEPKTGSVSRYVQDQVLMAAKLVATRGFAGLLGSRAAGEDGSDPNTTDTVGTVDDDDDEGDEGPEEDRDSLGELDDLDLDDEEEDYEGQARRRTRTRASESDSLASTKARRPPHRQRSQSRRRADSRRERGHSDGPARAGRMRQGGDGSARGARRAAASSVAPPRKLVPMTQCPTTQHRIECFRTQSGRVRCYMTARHPVKCHVEDGRIVCKATVNPETSHLPYPCNAAWH